jgi:SSS family solute:Na+ symporter
LLPVVRAGKPSGLGITRICALITGVLVLATALAVSDVLGALTLAYNLLVGGMLIPLLGAIFWKRATPAAAMTSMILGCVTATTFMLKDGIDANTPIYYSLAAGLASFVAVSVLSQRTGSVAASAARAENPF